jgi:hypothetical protein
MAVQVNDGPVQPATALAFACALVSKLDGEVVALPLLVMDTYSKVGTAAFGTNILASTTPQRRLLIGISPDVAIHQAAFQLKVERSPDPGA